MSVCVCVCVCMHVCVHKCTQSIESHHIHIHDLRDDHLVLEVGGGSNLHIACMSVPVIIDIAS